MQQATIISERARAYYGLPDLAVAEDLHNSLEIDGTVTDHHKVLATKLFNVHYNLVTEDQRRAAKQVSMGSRYSPQGFSRRYP